MNRLGLEHLTVLGMPPPDVVTLAADAGLRSVGLFTHQRDVNPGGYAQWSLLSDSQLRRETKARMSDRGIVFAFGDACHIGPDIDVSAWQPTVDVFVELGAERINLLCWERDRARAFDQFAKFAEMTRAAGTRMMCEYALGRVFRRLDDVVEAIAHAGTQPAGPPDTGPAHAGPQHTSPAHAGPPHIGICIDFMHYFRGGHTVADIARFDPALFQYIQFCDAPLKGEKHYLEEAMTQRLLPGEGELPVRELLAALPRDIPVSIELPHKRLADAGMGPFERVRLAAEATRALLADIAAQDADMT